jgi:hypothetical protein
MGPSAWPQRAHGSVGWCRLAAAARAFWCWLPHPPLVVPPAVLVLAHAIYGVIRCTDARPPAGTRGPSGVSRRSFVLCGSSTIFQPSGWQVRQYSRGRPRRRPASISKGWLHSLHVLAMAESLNLRLRVGVDCAHGRCGSAERRCEVVGGATLGFFEAGEVGSGVGRAGCRAA